MLRKNEKAEIRQETVTASCLIHIENDQEDIYNTGKVLCYVSC